MRNEKSKIDIFIPRERKCFFPTLEGVNRAFGSVDQPSWEGKETLSLPRFEGYFLP
jgi:hypothetical protein